MICKIAVYKRLDTKLSQQTCYHRASQVAVIGHYPLIDLRWLCPKCALICAALIQMNETSCPECHAGSSAAGSFVVRCLVSRQPVWVFCSVALAMALGPILVPRAPFTKKLNLTAKPKPKPRAAAPPKGENWLEVQRSLMWGQPPKRLWACHKALRLHGRECCGLCVHLHRQLAKNGSPSKRPETASVWCSPRPYTRGRSFLESCLLWVCAT